MLLRQQLGITRRAPMLGGKMIKKNKILTIIFERWPVAVIILGIVLSIAWLAALVWLPMYMLSII